LTHTHAQDNLCSFDLSLSLSQAKESAADSAKTHESVARDRSYAIDACVVRVMKARKKLSHTLLMAEVFAQLAFPTNGPDVKARIATLIEREYLERDEEQPNTYIYLA